MTSCLYVRFDQSSVQIRVICGQHDDNPAIAGFLDQNCCGLSVAIQILHGSEWLNISSSTGFKPAPLIVEVQNTVY
jgi:hypothetical protein